MSVPAALRTLTVAVAAVLATLGLTAVAQAATINYVALGDSYSSGVGAGSYLDSSSCKRSAKAYPELYANATGASISFQACSGAKTGDVLSNQVGALNANTTLVSITVGGNDAGFSSVMEDCILGGDSGCKTAVTNATDYVYSTLPGLLDNVYSTIRSKAPKAKVVVLGYPHFYKIGGSCSVGLSDTSRGYINGGADALDTVISKEAANAGFTFADVRQAFTGHEICSGSAWLNSVTWPVDESYHPTATGQANGYYPTFTGAL
ncbi:lysophospholipase L1-like esterase [Amycolatopsis bartoniae]|uniref:Hydrolase n=1 Tax=Amycolatopsis bartoniae TaxID=941986 RepID=A0A8H9ISI0_9PSEU|nr:SGNH/GDSL hydrolase family protein [Amycolatopsis bartoniae]MBB2934510.1 lysophospholipase L1-like esterase [Amycolatopsis bartoniae]TVT01888.1 SGNH/GDSL hydrolase family protein [Amycolatopsis bartoniae]GHF46855.1 hydrolase [Amycolatopsis bartoniae]